MISSREARELATGKNAELRKTCEADLNSAIKAAATLGATEVKLHRGMGLVNIMEEIAKANGFDATICRSPDKRDVDYLVVRW